jgi:hypothetical protein
MGRHLAELGHGLHGNLFVPALTFRAGWKTVIEYEETVKARSAVTDMREGS